MANAELFTSPPGESSVESYLRLINGLNQHFVVPKEGCGFAGFNPVHCWIDKKLGFLLAGTSGDGYLSIVATKTASTKKFPESPFYYAIGLSSTLESMVTMAGDFRWIHTLPTSNEEVHTVPNNLSSTLGILALTKFDITLSAEVSMAFESAVMR